MVTDIRSLAKIENDLNTMDIKIGLLVRNRITLQVRFDHSLDFHTIAVGYLPCITTKFCIVPREWRVQSLTYFQSQSVTSTSFGETLQFLFC